MNSSYAVFSDVDETLIRFKSMMTFMHYFLYETAFSRSELAPEKQAEFLAIQQANTPSADRVALNRRFYAMFAGISQTQLAQAAREWVQSVFQKGSLFVEQTRKELEMHRAAGAHVVLVSGSFSDIIDPMCNHVKAQKLLCSELEVVDGLYTGRLLQQVIGDAKWDVIMRHTQDMEIDWEQCYAYGDHPSDLCFMEKVGTKVVVGHHPEMLKLAEKNGWRVIAAN